MELTKTTIQAIQMAALGFFCTDLEEYSEYERFMSGDESIQLWEPFENFPHEEIVEMVDNLELDMQRIARLAIAESKKESK
ncbi:MAG: hypothetical protein KBE02_01450 [Sulfurospirillum sp.]|nr:hypothetical protein [Sulfurospirillum sp.]